MWTNKPPLGRGINYSHRLGNGLVKCWLFNEGSGDRVSSVDGFGGSSVGSGGNLWVPGLDNWSLNLDGTDNYITTGYTPPPVCTIGLKFRPIAATGYIFNTGVAGNYPALLFTTTYYNYYGSGFDLYPSTGPGILGKWQTVVLTHRPAVKAEMFYNGYLIASDSTITSLTFGPLIIGQKSDGSSRANGVLEFFYIWNRILTPDEILHFTAQPYSMFIPSRPIWVKPALEDIEITPTAVTGIGGVVSPTVSEFYAGGGGGLGYGLYPGHYKRRRK